MTLRPSPLVFLLLLALLAAGCPGDAPVPGDFSVELSEGGGATGRWTGTLVAADGEITVWEKAPGGVPEPTGVPARELSPETRSALWSAIREAGVLESAGLAKPEDSGPGNFSRMIRITADDETTDLIWPRVLGDQGPLDSLFARCQELIRPPASAR